MSKVISSRFTGLDKETHIVSSTSILSFRLQTINSTFIRYLTTKNSFEIYLNSSFKINIAPRE